jgi:hypothetical protein
VKAIDSQPQYCAKTQASVAESQAYCGKIEMNCVDVGPLAPWGHPIKNKTAANYFDLYVNAIDHFSDRYYDSILVDGRFRTACAVKALNYARRDTFVLIHDYLPDSRREYTRVTKYYDLLAEMGDLAVFGVKEGLNQSVLSEKEHLLYPETLRRRLA